MSRKNICKFPTTGVLDSLNVDCFVLENNLDVMKISTLLNKYRMILISNGYGLIHFDNQVVEFSQGELFFGFRDEQFRITNAQDVSYMYIDFDGSRVHDLFNRFKINRINRKFSSMDGLIPLWKENLSRASEQTIDLATESMLLYTFSRISSNTGQKERLINEILEKTDNEFRNYDLSISKIADDLGYNVKYLSHLFKTKVGVPYTEYLSSVRVNYAISLFDHGLDSIKNVAVLSGFIDQFYFSNVFKKKTGISPKEYLKKTKTKIV